MKKVLRKNLSGGDSANLNREKSLGKRPVTTCPESNIQPGANSNKKLSTMPAKKKTKKTKKFRIITKRPSVVETQVSSEMSKTISEQFKNSDCLKNSVGDCKPNLSVSTNKKASLRKPLIGTPNQVKDTEHKQKDLTSLPDFPNDESVGVYKQCKAPEFSSNSNSDRKTKLSLSRKKKTSFIKPLLVTPHEVKDTHHEKNAMTPSKKSVGVGKKLKGTELTTFGSDLRTNLSLSRNKKASFSKPILGTPNNVKRTQHEQKDMTNMYNSPSDESVGVHNKPFKGTDFLRNFDSNRKTNLSVSENKKVSLRKPLIGTPNEVKNTYEQEDMTSLPDSSSDETVRGHKQFKGTGILSNSDRDRITNLSLSGNEKASLSKPLIGIQKKINDTIQDQKATINICNSSNNLVVGRHNKPSADLNAFSSKIDKGSNSEMETKKYTKALHTKPFEEKHFEANLPESFVQNNSNDCVSERVNEEETPTPTNFQMSKKSTFILDEDINNSLYQQINKENTPKNPNFFEMNRKLTFFVPKNIDISLPQTVSYEDPPTPPNSEISTESTLTGQGIVNKNLCPTIDTEDLFKPINNPPNRRSFISKIPVLVPRKLERHSEEQDNQIESAEVERQCLDRKLLELLRWNKIRRNKKHPFSQETRKEFQKLFGYKQSTHPSFKHPQHKVTDEELWNEFKKLFKSYVSNSRRTSEVISPRNSALWMRASDVIPQYMSDEEAAVVFKKIVGNKITMNAKEYKEYLITISLKMKLPFYEIYRKMCFL